MAEGVPAATDGTPTKGQATPRTLGWRSARKTIVRVGLIAQSVSTGCLVFPLAIVALVAAVASLAFAPADGAFVLGVFGVVAALTALGLLLAFVATKLGPAINQWSLVAYIAQIVLVPVGALLVASSTFLSDQAGSPANPGTDGPFADGITGGIGLMGLGLVFGGALVVLPLLWAALEALVDEFLGRVTTGDSG